MPRFNDRFPIDCKDPNHRQPCRRHDVEVVMTARDANSLRVCANLFMDAVLRRREADDG